MFTIIGGGFGLYGYLPAIVNATCEKVLLAERYRETIEGRPELNSYLDSIEWRPSLSAALSAASTVVLAVPPEAQEALIRSISKAANLNSLIVEKPIAATASEAADLVLKLVINSKRFRVGYTFLFTKWCKDLQESLFLPKAAIHINWTFRADHFRNDRDSWKRRHSAGGGVLRFYGIHLIAVLAALGCTGVLCSTLGGENPDEPRQWRASFCGGAAWPYCSVIVDTDSDKTSFSIWVTELDGTNLEIYSAASPFAMSAQSEGDDRIGVLEKLIRSLDDNDKQYLSLYSSTNKLWAKIEACNNGALGCC